MQLESSQWATAVHAERKWTDDVRDLLKTVYLGPVQEMQESHRPVWLGDANDREDLEQKAPFNPWDLIPLHLENYSSRMGGGGGDVVADCAAQESV
jgi:hypothetical protein